MPPKGSKKKEQEPESHIFFEDTVADHVMMYPVFCTANIPLKILDDFIAQANEGGLSLVPGDYGGSPCVLKTTDLDSVAHGSRTPTQAFESPFLGMTDDEIRGWMREHKHPGFAQLTFTILDEDTVRNKTCRIGYTLDNDGMLICDFWASMVIRVPIEMVTLTWDDEELVGTGRVCDRAYLDRTAHKLRKAIL